MNISINKQLIPRGTTGKYQKYFYISGINVYYIYITKEKKYNSIFYIKKHEHYNK